MPKIVKLVNDPFPIKKGDVVTVGRQGRKPYRVVRINPSGESAFVERVHGHSIETVMARLTDLFRYHGTMLPEGEK